MLKNFLVILVSIHLTTCALKYNMIAPQDIVEGDEEVFFNGIKIPKTLYVSPKVYVVGVLLNEASIGQNVRPVDTSFMFVDKEVDIRLKDFKKKYKGPKMADSLGFPMFEVEVGREPLEFLLNTLDTKFGIDAWPTSRVGIGNQYGYTYLNPDDFPDERYFGSSVSNMNPNSNSAYIEHGCYLGSFMGTVPSKPDFSRFEESPKKMLTMMWQMYQHASKPVPVIYIGYTIGANFSKIDPFFTKGQKVYFPTQSTIGFSKSIGLNNATQGSISPSAAFLRMALMLDNLTDGIVSKANGLKEQIRVEEMRQTGGKEDSNVQLFMDRIRI